MEPIVSRRQGLSDAVGLAALIVVIVSIAVPRILNADLIEADLGFGIVDYITSIVHTDILNRGVPQGLESYGVTIPMRLARLLALGMGISPIVIQQVYYALEPLALAGAGFVLVRTLLPFSTAPFRMFFVIVLIASNLRNANFGTWPSPFYSGSYYVFAECLGMLAICAILRSRTLAGALLLAACLATHLAIGIGFLAFAGAVVMTRLTQGALSVRTFLVGSASFAIILGGWLWLTLDPSTVTGQIAPDMWKAITFASSYHTFPVQSGFLGLRHETYFTGFVAFSIVLIGGMTRLWTRLPYRWEMVAGLAFVCLPTALGLYASWSEWSPFWLKMHLHRLNSIILLFGAPYVVAELWNLIFERRISTAVLAAFALIGPFYLPHGVALIPAVAVVGVESARLAAERRTQAAIVCWVALGVVGALYMTYVYMGYLKPAAPMYVGLTPNAFALGAMAAAIAAVIAAKLFPRISWTLPLVLVTIAGLLATDLQRTTWPLAQGTEAAHDFFDVQKWAKAETAPDAIFLVDPTHSYGWRGFSERATLGSIREWLFTNVVYSSKPGAVERGLGLLDDFGLDRAKFFQGGEPLNGYYYALFQLRERFCGFDASWFEKMKAKYDVDYVVFDRANCKTSPALPVAYENRSYVVGRIP